MQVADLVSQLEEAKFAQLFRYMVAHPAPSDNLDRPPRAIGLQHTELLVRTHGQVSALRSWANNWIFQSLYLPVGLWTPGAIASLGRRIDAAVSDIANLPDPSSLFYDSDIPSDAPMQYPIVTDASYYLFSNVCIPEVECEFAKITAKLEGLLGAFKGVSGRGVDFGFTTPEILQKQAASEVDKFVIDLLKRPSSYYFMAREGHISVAPVIDHGSYVTKDPEAKRLHAATATSALRLTDPLIQELESLLNARGTRELDIQAFFTSHPQFLCALDERYCEIRPFVSLTGRNDTRLIPDFLVQLDGLQPSWNLIELKRPTAPMIFARSRAENVAAPAAKAIAQLLDYRDVLATTSGRKALASQFACAPYEPCLTILIGRGAPDTRFRWTAQTLGIPDVELVTYDYLLERARKCRESCDIGLADIAGNPA